MNAFLLAAEEGAAEKLLLQYIAYAAIIVAGILLLVLLNRLTGLPKHGELKVKLESFAEGLDKLSAQSKAYDRLKTVTKLIYRLDKLVYVSFTMSQKERDGDLDSLSSMLEGARNELTAYKTQKCEDAQRLANAHAKIDDASALLERIIERDRSIDQKHE